MLPSLTGGGTTINGYSQPGAAPAVNETPAMILIEIDGTNTTNQSGLYIGSANNIVQGVACAPLHCNWGRSPCPKSLPVLRRSASAPKPLKTNTRLGTYHLRQVIQPRANKKAGDGIRTRDSLLGKQLRYHCATPA